MIDRAALLAIVNRPTEPIPLTPVLEDPAPRPDTRAIRNELVRIQSSTTASRRIVSQVLAELLNGSSGLLHRP